MKTRAVRLVAPKKVEVVDYELSVGPEDVLVKTHLAGICGTDKNFYKGILPDMQGPGYSKDRPLVTFPFMIGHEGGGVVLEVGSHVRKYRPGDFVMSFNRNVTMAEHFVAPEYRLEMAPAGLSKELACLGEPIACAMFSGLNSKVNLGDTAVVYGAGFAGQTIAQVMKKKGALQLIVVDIVDEKLQIAKELGADVIINARKDNPVEAILDLTKGLGADVVAEVAGAEAAVNNAIQSVRKNGQLVFYSWVTQSIRLNIARFHHDSLNIDNTGLVHHTVNERMVWTPWALRPVQQGPGPVRSAGQPAVRDRGCRQGVRDRRRRPAGNQGGFRLLARAAAGRRNRPASSSRAGAVAADLSTRRKSTGNGNPTWLVNQVRGVPGTAHKNCRGTPGPDRNMPKDRGWVTKTGTLSWQPGKISNKSKNDSGSQLRIIIN